MTEGGNFHLGGQDRPLRGPDIWTTWESQCYEDLWQKQREEQNPRPQTRNEFEDLMCEKEGPCGWRIHNNAEKVDKMGEIEKTKKRSPNFILNMMKSYYRILSKWAIWSTYIFKDHSGAAKWKLGQGRARKVLDKLGSFCKGTNERWWWSGLGYSGSSWWSGEIQDIFWSNSWLALLMVVVE